MARATKKKKELTIEEKLAEALVPESEQPYPVPENWCWVPLSELLIPSKEKTEDFSNLSTKYIGLENMEKDSGIISFGSVEGVKSTKSIFSEGQILYGKLRPYLNKHGIAEFDGVCSTDILVFDTKDTTFNKFINYYFDQQHFIEYAISNSKGINLPRVSESIVLDAKCPLPPLPEQQRIVDRIESLFAKLDEAKEKAQAVVDGFDLYISQIRYNAFSGELTASWRQKHSHLQSTWKQYELRELLSLITYGFTNPMPDAEEGPWKITAKSIHDGFIDYSISRKTTQEAFECNLTEKSKPCINDVLLTKDGSIGRVAVVDRDGICINQSVALLRPNEKIRAAFLRELLLSPYYQRIMELQSGGTALKHIYITRVDKMSVLVPSLNEQDEVVRVLTSLVNKEQQAKEAAEQVISQIDTMKKSILARAFRGELGTNDPTGESAIELLKRVL